MMTPISKNTIDKVNYFRRRFQGLGYEDGHYIFALQAAFPLALTPDLLQQLWANFKQYPTTADSTKSIDFMAISDILLSPLVREVSRGIFEMDMETRAYLLNELKLDSRFGLIRMKALGYFLYQYSQEVAIQHHSKTFVDAQTWTALATIAPKQAAQLISNALKNAIKNETPSEIFRIRNLTESFANQDAAFENLVHYMKGLKAAILDYPDSVVQEQFEKAKVGALTIGEGLGNEGRILEVPVLKGIEKLVKLPQRVVKKQPKKIKKRRDTARVFALLVGINEYHPESKVRKLRGCLNDVEAMKSMLVEIYECQSKDIKTLTNTQATRESILKAFQIHLYENSNIQSGDTVLFYFSGHGSYAPTATEFESFDAQKQDETLVCYDSRISDGKHFDLSDKELAVLISRVRTEVEVVTIIDASHSYPMTRMAIIEDVDDSETFPRSKYPSDIPRTIDTYLLPNDNFYLNQNKVFVPSREHITLSACSRDEKAWEKFEKGVFTNELVKILKQIKGNITYRGIYDLVSISLKKIVKDQTPQIAITTNFDIKKIFLKDVKIRFSPPFLIEYRNDNWCLNNGAIHGLKTDKQSVEALRIAVYQESDNGYEYLGNASIDKVKFKECLLQSDLFNKLNIQKLNRLPLYATKKEKDHPIYWGGIITIRPNLFVRLNASREKQKEFLTHFNNYNSPFIEFLTESELLNIRYELILDLEKLIIKDRITDSLIHGCLGNDINAISYIIDKLLQIEEWERIAKLENLNTQLDISKIEVRFLEEGEMKYFDESVIDLEGTEEGLLFQIQARNLSDMDLYIGLVHLSPQYGIGNFFECDKILANNATWITLDDRHVLKFEKKQKNFVRDIFKIIVSTASFDDYSFNKKSLEYGEIVIPESFRDAPLRTSPNPPESDWFTKTITTNLSRKVNKGYSLHIGLNAVDPESAEYDGWEGRLAGSEADASAMLDIAKSLNYTETKILLTKEATRQAFFENVEAIREKLKPGDLFLLTFSGHGGQVPDVNGDKADGLDETWCMYDTQVLDDELLDLLKTFNEGINILIISDNCVSGDLLRGSKESIEKRTSEEIEKTENSAIAPDNQIIISEEWLFGDIKRINNFEIKTSVQLISFSPEFRSYGKGRKNGIFTEAILKTWKEGKFHGNYHDFYFALVSEIPFKSDPPNYLKIGPLDKLFEDKKPFTY